MTILLLFVVITTATFIIGGIIGNFIVNKSKEVL